jgi:hypothetical protein
MGEESNTGGKDGRIVLARGPVDARAHVRVGARVLTMELAEKFAAELLADASHSVESASFEVGLRPSTVRDAISRYLNDKCTSLEDEAVCEVVAKAKTEHVKKLRAWGYIEASKENRAGTSWAQWQLEVTDPLHHPRKQVEVKGEASAQANADGSSEARIRYVITVPQEEPEE